MEVISARLRYPEAQQAQILDHFIKGGDLTADGIMHAITSAAQIQDDGDTAWDLENTALDALSIAASASPSLTGRFPAHPNPAGPGTAPLPCGGGTPRERH